MEERINHHRQTHNTMEWRHTHNANYITEAYYYWAN